MGTVSLASEPPERGFVFADMSKADDLIPLPDGMSVQRLTVADKDEVIKIHDNVKDGTDRLPAYYDYLISLPEVIALGIYMNEKMVGLF